MTLSDIFAGQADGLKPREEPQIMGMEKKNNDTEDVPKMESKKHVLETSHHMLDTPGQGGGMMAALNGPAPGMGFSGSSKSMDIDKFLGTGSRKKTSGTDKISGMLGMGEKSKGIDINKILGGNGSKSSNSNVNGILGLGGGNTGNAMNKILGTSGKGNGGFDVGKMFGTSGNNKGGDAMSKILGTGKSKKGSGMDQFLPKMSGLKSPKMSGFAGIQKPKMAGLNIGGTAMVFDKKVPTAKQTFNMNGFLHEFTGKNFQKSIMGAERKATTKIGSTTERKARKRMKQQKGLSLFGDKDRDGVPNILDCNPLDKMLQGPEHDIEDIVEGEEKIKEEEEAKKIPTQEEAAIIEEMVPEESMEVTSTSDFIVDSPEEVIGVVDDEKKKSGFIEKIRTKGEKAIEFRTALFDIRKGLLPTREEKEIERLGGGIEGAEKFTRLEKARIEGRAKIAAAKVPRGVISSGRRAKKAKGYQTADERMGKALAGASAGLALPAGGGFGLTEMSAIRSSGFGIQQAAVTGTVPFSQKVSDIVGTPAPSLMPLPQPVQQPQLQIQQVPIQQVQPQAIQTPQQIAGPGERAPKGVCPSGLIWSQRSQRCVASLRGPYRKRF